MRALTVSFKDGSCAVTWRFQFDELVVSAGNKVRIKKRTIKETGGGIGGGR